MKRETVGVITPRVGPRHVYCTVSPYHGVSKAQMLLHNPESSVPCACFSFCTSHDTVHALTLIPTTLASHDSPWRSYLQAIYGASFAPAINVHLDELARLQIVYTHGLPASRCAPTHGWSVERATIPQLPRRVDALSRQ